MKYSTQIKENAFSMTLKTKEKTHDHNTHCFIADFLFICIETTR